MLTALRKRFGMMTEIPPNQQNVGSSCNPYEIHRPEGRLFPADKRKKNPFSFVAQKIWPASQLAALYRSQFRYRFSPLLVCKSYLKKTANKPVSQMSFLLFLDQRKCLMSQNPCRN